MQGLAAEADGGLAVQGGGGLDDGMEAAPAELPEETSMRDVVGSGGDASARPSTEGELEAAVGAAAEEAERGSQQRELEQEQEQGPPPTSPTGEAARAPHSASLLMCLSALTGSG